MSNGKPSYEELEQRLAEAESIIAAIENEQVDAIVGKERIYLVRLKEMEEALKKSNEELETRVRQRTAELEEKNAKLDEYNRRLEELNKELQDFAHIASHDLQEPLRKVRTFGDLLIRQAADVLDEDCQDYIQRMQNATQRMQALLNSLLAYSRVTTRGESMTKTALEKSVAAALSNLQILVEEKNARVEVEGLPRLRADHVQMIQLFQNLIGNAVKFHRTGEAPRVQIYAKSDSTKAGRHKIFIQDNGIGINENYFYQIFLPFCKLHTPLEYEGVGMGLAICRKIMKRHQGEINVQSREGKGTTFIITLPDEQV